MDEEKAGQSSRRITIRARWLLVFLVIPISITLCGQVGWMLNSGEEDVEVRSSLTADYSPWSSAFFPGLDPGILLAALRDRRESALDTRRSLNCFLVTAGCKKVPDVNDGDGDGSPSPMRIASISDPVFAQTDGLGMMIEPGGEIIFDIRSRPIFISDSDLGNADFLLFFFDTDQAQTAHIEVALSTERSQGWVAVYAGWDQAHGDIDPTFPYSSEDEISGGSFDPGMSSDDGSFIGTQGLAIDVDEGSITPGLYNWLRITVDERALLPVGIDAIIMLDSAE